MVPDFSIARLSKHPKRLPFQGRWLGAAETERLSQTCDETLEFQIGTLIVPEPPAEAAQPAPVYHVTDKDGNQIPYTAAREGGVLTIRVDAAYARLTLTADEAQALTAQGVEKVVFITTGATSAFRPADLTAYKDEAPFVLTHDGETVTFTAGETDLASLLLQA